MFQQRATGSAGVRAGRMAKQDDCRRTAPLYICLALSTGVMQAATLFTFDRMQVGYSLALFQLSSLISVFFGHRYFKEPHFGRRLAASGIMVAGAALIVAR